MSKTKKPAAKAAKAGKPAKSAGAKTGATSGGEAKAAKGGAFKVRATQPGYYDNKRRREGDVFTIASAKEFSEKWMERVSRGTPEKITTGQEEINRQHDEVLNEKLAGKATGGANPLGAD